MRALTCKKCQKKVWIIHHDGSCSSCFNFSRERRRSLDTEINKIKSEKASEKRVADDTDPEKRALRLDRKREMARAHTLKIKAQRKAGK